MESAMPGEAVVPEIKDGTLQGEKDVCLGYSERGLVNALVESIMYPPDAVSSRSLLREILNASTWFDKGPEIPVKETCPEISEFEMYVEPSLSDFGDPDLVVITHHRTTSSYERRVWFIEAKLEPILESYRKGKQRKTWKKHDEDYSSTSVLHEMFLKFAFWNGVRSHEREKDTSTFQTRVFGKTRKIGEDPLVLELASKIRGVSHVPTFVAVTTDVFQRVSKHNHDEPMSFPCRGRFCAYPGGGVSIQEVLVRISENLHAANEIGGGWFHELTRVLTWQTLYDLAGKHGMNALSGSIDYNHPKFAFDVVWKDEVDLEEMKPRLQECLSRYGLVLRTKNIRRPILNGEARKGPRDNIPVFEEEGRDFIKGEQGISPCYVLYKNKRRVATLVKGLRGLEFRFEEKAEGKRKRKGKRPLHIPLGVMSHPEATRKIPEYL
jgi:hypothetical protein